MDLSMDDGSGYAMEERSCVRAQFGWLCGGGAMRLCCRQVSAVRESTATRSAYILLLVLSVVLMAVCMSGPVQAGVMASFGESSLICDYIGADEGCEDVLGYMAVYRLGLATAFYHVMLAIATYGTVRSTGCRASLHNGMWFYKAVLLLFLVGGAFLIPDPHEYFIITWMYVAMAASGVFILVQLTLVVVVVHRWADAVVRRVNGGASACVWYGGVFGGVAVTGFTLSGVMTSTLLYLFAWDHHCTSNQWLVVGSVLACMVVSVVVSARECARGGTRVLLRLFQSSLVTLYVTHVTWTAIVTAPRQARTHVSARYTGHTYTGTYTPHRCGPYEGSDPWLDYVTPCVTVGVMFVTLISASFGGDKAREHNLDTEYTEEEEKCVIVLEDVGGQRVLRNEKERVVYSYTLFHTLVCLASVYMMMCVTAWHTPTTASQVSFGRSWTAMYVLVASSWLCIVMYLLMLLCPSLVPKTYRHRLYLSPDVSQRSLSRAVSQLSGFGANGTVHQRSFFSSNASIAASIAVSERLRRFSVCSSASVDCVPLAKCEIPPIQACHRETTV